MVKDCDGSIVANVNDCWQRMMVINDFLFDNGQLVAKMAGECLTVVYDDHFACLGLISRDDQSNR